MTPRQKAIVAYVFMYRNIHGYSPSYREIAEGVGLSSVASVKKQLDRLRAAGFIDFEDGKPRTLRVVA